MRMAAAPQLNDLKQIETIEIEVSLVARDRLRLHVDVGSDGVIESATLTGSGCSELLRLIVEMRARLQGPLADVTLPEGTGHAAILMRELLLRAKGQWHFPFPEEELCHCRGIATQKVDEAIVSGCHDLDSIRRATSANTSCGTCRWDIDSILKYRLHQKT